MPGVAGVVVPTSIIKFLAIDVPQALVAVTLNVPLVVGVKVTELVVLVAVPPPV